MYALASLGLHRSAVAFAVRHLMLCKRSDVSSGVAWSPPLCRWLLRGVNAALGALQGVGCTPWRPTPWRPWVSAALPVAFAWQVRHLVLCKRSDVRPGVPWSPALCRGFCVAGAALGALQAVGCTPWRPLVSAALPVAFAWQVRHLVLCKGSDVRPGVAWSPPLCQWLLRGRRSTWCSARGSLGLCWPILGAMLAHVGAMLAHLEAYVGPC